MQEEAIPSDSLYAVHRKNSRKATSDQPQRPPLRTPPINAAGGQPDLPALPGSRGPQPDRAGQQMGLADTARGQADLAHWSSHGYLAKEPDNGNDSGMSSTNKTLQIRGSL